MPTARSPDTDQLLDQAAHGDPQAKGQLLERHRSRLREMIALRLDRRLAARVDPSDVVQETLAEAAQKLTSYLRKRPLPFYPWLRQLALERIGEMHRQHLKVRKRSVQREAFPLPHLPDESALELADHLYARGSRPNSGLARREAAERVRSALGQLRERDREILVLRHLEQLPVREIAAILQITEGAVKVRLVRALERLRDLLGEDPREHAP